MTGARAPRRSRSVTVRASRSELEERILELEQRLVELEGRRPSMDSTRTWFRGVVPPEASRHFRTAGREQLLGLRALVDHWIGRLEAETRPEPRETIPIE